MSAAGLLAPAPAPAGAPPAPEYYPEEDEELESAEDDERSCRGRESDEDTEDASETDLAKHDEEDYVEMKEQMYQDKLASLKRQLQQLQEGTLQEYQKRMKKLDQQYKERIRNAETFARYFGNVDVDFVSGVVALLIPVLFCSLWDCGT
ncbi:Sin3 histone deacetylase corepressor complex component SDS3 [Sciurus carolinensis]|uniref:Sin3 histone deacetylase corepressor complex component SDS3 n=1 Tax=Sciurus carolinensis TaxID=30640 RepID=A0AA41NHS6_SCICA|nr:Sin3 histone deacetylase corepressor complex component SDS3 [Sciurus carolinensis]